MRFVIIFEIHYINSFCSCLGLNHLPQLPDELRRRKHMVRSVDDLIEESACSFLASIGLSAGPIGLILLAFFQGLFAAFLIVQGLDLLVFKEAARAAGEGNDFARHVGLRNLLVSGHRLQIQIEFALR